MHTDLDHRRLLSALAAELRGTGRQVEQLATALAMDEELLGRFLSHLQSFDLIAQQVGESAALLEQVTAGRSLNAALGGVRLEQMRERLRAAIAGDHGLAAA